MGDNRPTAAHAVTALQHKDRLDGGERSQLLEKRPPVRHAFNVEGRDAGLRVLATVAHIVGPIEPSAIADREDLAEMKPARLAER